MLEPPPETLAVAASYRFDGDFQIGAHALRLQHYDGFSVWDAALICAKVFERRPALLLAQGPNILELGTGTGALGLAAALLGADVLLTDLPAMHETVQLNVQLNTEVIAAAGGAARFVPLDWNCLDLAQLHAYDSVDTMLAADPVWRVEQASTFAKLTQRLLSRFQCRMLLARSDRTCVEEATKALFAAFVFEQLTMEAVDLLHPDLEGLKLPLSG